MKNQANSKNAVIGRLVHPTRDEYAKAAYNHLKSIKTGGLSDSAIENLAEEKTNSYVEAVKTVDEAIAALQAISAELPAGAKAEIDAAVATATGFSMFNGEASLVKNSHWDGTGGWG